MIKSSTSEQYFYFNLTKKDDKSSLIGLRKDFTSIINWLKEKGYYEKIFVLPQEIDYMVLEKNDVRMRDSDGKPKQVEIRDPNVIEELLNFDGPDQLLDQEPIIVGFYTKGVNGQVYHTVMYPGSQISAELKAYINRLSQ
jgi:ABC-2 type transport system permease protein